MENQQVKEKDRELIENCFKIIRFFAKHKGFEQYDENKVHLLLDLLKYLRSLVDLNSQKISKFGTQHVVDIIRCFLIESKPLLRQNAIKFFRIILDTPSLAELYKRKNIPLFIARSLEKDIRQESKAQNQQHVIQEVIQSLKLIRKWIEVAPRTFPKLLSNSLVAFAESADEQFKKGAVETVRKLALGNPELCAFSGGIKLLINSITDPQLSEISQSIVYTLLYLINEPNHRDNIYVYLDLPNLFAIFTDIDPQTSGSKQDKADASRFELQLNLAKKAMITIMKSWTGLIYLGNEKIALKSMIQALRQPIQPMIRNAIYEILGELLAIGNKENQIGNGFRVQNLLNYYLVMLVQVLLDCDLFKILVELSGIEDPQISKLGQKFLKELTQLMFNLLPNCNQYTDFLLSSASQSDNLLVDLKAWSSNIVNIMGNYVFDASSEKKKKSVPSKFLYQCENLYLTTQVGLPSHRINKETIGKIQYQIESQADDTKFQTLLKNSKVQELKDSYQLWNWESILEIIQNYLYNNARFNKVMENKFIKRVLAYFHPRSQFIKQDWNQNDKAFIQAKTGYLLLKLLVKTQEGRKMLKQAPDTLFDFSRSFMPELYAILQSEINPQMAQSQNQQPLPLLQRDKFSVKMIRELISWIGLLSSSKNGLDLLNQFKIFDSLRLYIEPKGQRDHILNLLLFCLDYGKSQQDKESKSREFLQICLEQGSENLKKSGLELLRLLYRSELQDYSTWAINLVVARMQDKSPSIVAKAQDVIQEVTQDPDIMAAFLQICPHIDQMNPDSSQFLITLLSNKKGFEKLTKEFNWTLKELEKWVETHNKEYVDKVEKCLLNALEFVGVEENQNIFRFPDLLNNPDNSFVTLGFIHRMPWIINLEYDCDEHKGWQQLQVTIEYNGVQKNQFILIGKPYHDQQVILNDSSNYVLGMQLQVGQCNIDNNCKDQQEPYQIRTDQNEKKNKSQFINNQYIIEKNGVQFIFDSINEGQHIMVSEVRIHMKMGENKQNMAQIPPHIFGELVKTKKGVELLKEQQYLDKFIEDIRNPNTPILTIRSSLWTLGHIGQSKRGINLLLEKGVIKDIVKMAEEQQYLSLRGTCLYILNMICFTNEGRQELEKYQWLSHWNTNLGWICIPKNTAQFFSIKFQNKNDFEQKIQEVAEPVVQVQKERSTIKELQATLMQSQILAKIQTEEQSIQSSVNKQVHNFRNTYWPLQKEEWKKFEQVQQQLHLNEDQLKLLENIALLSNLLTQKFATREIKQIAKKKPELFKDRFVFHAVLLMLSFYRFRNDARKMIFGFFDKRINQPNIFVTLDANKLFTETII